MLSCYFDPKNYLKLQIGLVRAEFRIGVYNEAMASRELPLFELWKRWAVKML